ncbi:MAG: SapC family protein [Sphingomonadales bacterium]|nr:SapC family protein [Sphingomonadales bacterium]
MPEQVEPLNTHQHRDLAMHASAGQHPHCVQIVTGEVGHAATCCPIFFVKDPETGRFNLIALFGFQPGDLLVQGMDQGSGQTSGQAGNSGRPLFIPLEMIRQGFFIDGDTIVIDPAHPRFAPGGTIPLFDAMGEPTDEMRLIQRSLGALVAGREATEAFTAEMMRLRLIEPIDISLRFDDGEKLTLEGLYTISLDALHDLPDADVLTLFRSGHLATAITIQASQRQVSALAQRKNNKITQA